tara:strand:+ start:4294 stop:5130 length:837 start_codon:yes stop_codon:yes gene_type:complete
MDSDLLHDKILYPVVRVRAGQAGGSGVLVYSEPDPKDDGKFINILLTCQHVIDGAIKIRDEWDAILKREVKRDVLDEVVIEVFDYDGSKVVSANSTTGQIIAYDKHHDLAAVKLNSNTRPLAHVASVIPQDEIQDLKLFDPVWVSGCSLLHDPFPNPGTITYLREVIDQKAYLMQNASSIFGNSGGGLFHGAEGHLLGLTSRVTVTQLGFGLDVQTWMGFSTHPDRLYEFFAHQELQFLYDKNDDYYKALGRRESRRKDALRSIILDSQGVMEDSDDG